MKYISKFAIKTVKFALDLFILFSFCYNSLCCFCFSEHRKRQKTQLFISHFHHGRIFLSQEVGKSTQPLEFFAL